MAKWIDQKDDIFAGREPQAKIDGFTVGNLCNHYLTDRQSLRDSGELAPRTFNRYFKTCEYIVECFDKNRLVDTLRPEDFRSLRSRMARRWGAVSLGNEIQMIRTVFRFGYENGLMDKPVRFGTMFRKPSAKTIRATRAANGPQMFTAEQIRKLLEHGSLNMRAMILLGVNCALGNTDLALLPIVAVDLEGEWLDYARAKTAIPRRIPLWPETVEAIKAVLAVRPEPKSEEDSHLLSLRSPQPAGSSSAKFSNGSRPENSRRSTTRGTPRVKTLDGVSPRPTSRNSSAAGPLYQHDLSHPLAQLMCALLACLDGQGGCRVGCPGTGRNPAQARPRISPFG